MLRLQWLDYRAMLRERKTWLVIVLLAYATLAMPAVLAKPPAHVQEAIRTWFGGGDAFVIFQFVWIDLAMNKMISFIPVVMASGLVLRERDTELLPLLASKPLSIPRYFVLRTVSACAVIGTLYIGTQLLGAGYFALRVPGFRAGTFLAAMTPHLFAALFATALAAAIGAWVRHRGASVLIGLAALGTLVGLSLIGYYQPAWRAWTMLNPITLGAIALGELDHLSAALLGPPILALALLTAATIAVGAVGARGIEP